MLLSDVFDDLTNLSNTASSGEFPLGAAVDHEVTTSANTLMKPGTSAPNRCGIKTVGGWKRGKAGPLVLIEAL